MACAVVLGEASDVTFDVGSEGEISFGGRGVEIGDLVLAEQGVVGDEDGAMAGGLTFGVAALLPERTTLALAGEETIVPAIGAAGAIGVCGGEAVRTGETGGTEGEVGGSKAGVALGVVDLACDELGVAV